MHSTLSYALDFFKDHTGHSQGERKMAKLIRNNLLTISPNCTILDYAKYILWFLIQDTSNSDVGYKIQNIVKTEANCIRELGEHCRM